MRTAAVIILLLAAIIALASLILYRHLAPPKVAIAVAVSFAVAVVLLAIGCARVDAHARYTERYWPNHRGWCIALNVLGWPGVLTVGDLLNAAFFLWAPEAPPLRHLREVK